MHFEGNAVIFSINVLLAKGLLLAMAADAILDELTLSRGISPGNGRKPPPPIPAINPSNTNHNSQL